MPGEEEMVFDIDPQGFLAAEDIEQELTDVERALTDLDEGRYGICVTCGAMIPDARLAEHPTERFCPDHEPRPTRPS